MYLYKEDIELCKLKTEISKFEFHSVNRWYDDIKHNGIKNYLLVNNKNIIRLGGTRYFILKLLKTKNYTKIPCIIFSKEKIKNKKQINIKLVSKLTGLHYEKIFRSIR